MKTKILKTLLLFVTIFSVPHFAGAATFFYDNLETGNLNYTQNGVSWHGGNSSNGGMVTISSDRAHSGMYSQKYHFPGNTVAAAALGNGPSAEERFDFGSGKSDVYIKYYIFLPANYAHANPMNSSTGGGTNNKFIMLWDDEANYGQSRVKMGSELWLDVSGDGGISKAMPKGPLNYNGTPTLSCVIDNTFISSDLGSYYPKLNTPWIITSSNLNKWTEIEWHMKVDDGSGNGALELWVDGVKKFGQTDLKYQSAPCAPGYFRAGYLMGWSDSGYAQDTDIYIDDVTFSDTYVSPDTTDMTPPAAPSGLTVQ